VWEGAGGLHPAHSSVESTGSAQLISALGWTHTGGLAVRGCRNCSLGRHPGQGAWRELGQWVRDRPKPVAVTQNPPPGLCKC
jgi:hypothetical protein